jgi:osmotically-inducible protein OsmY
MVSLAKETAFSVDRELEHRVVHHLHDRNIHALRNIAVVADEGKVTLRGTVTSFYHKQLCIHACRTVPGVAGLIDEVEVDSIL